MEALSFELVASSFYYEYIESLLTASLKLGTLGPGFVRLLAYVVLAQHWALARSSSNQNILSQVFGYSRYHSKAI